MSRRTVTVDEFERIPDDDFKYELVAGVVHRMSPVGGLHGVVVVRLVAALVEWAERNRAGAVMTETGFVLARDPDTVLAPDVSFMRQERVAADGLPTGFWHAAPDLAVEVLSPDERPRQAADKVRDYLTHGVALVWVVDPAARTITVHSTATAVTLTAGELLDGGSVLAGFKAPAGRFFPAL
jgi:Uma2 family endonuclease